MTDVRAHLERSARELAATAAECEEAILEAAACMTEAVRRGGKILLCGNGGSAADAQHFAAELVGRLDRRRERPAIPALALTTDTSILTAWSNDRSFSEVFARQVEALGREGDALLLISTSGNSENLRLAAAAARERGVATIGLLGASGGSLAPGVDHAILVPADDTQHVQECHAAIAHVLCSLIEKALFPASTDGRVPVPRGGRRAGEAP